MKENLKHFRVSIWKSEYTFRELSSIQGLHFPYNFIPIIISLNTAVLQGTVLLQRLHAMGI